MNGMNKHTGRAISGIEHIQQSVSDILSTPVGSRVMRREYGSLLPEMLDQPLNNASLVRAYAAIVMALIRWEPRIRINAVRQTVDAKTPGRAVFTIDAITTEGNNINVEMPLS